jgi:hypothetical protein
MAKTFVNVTRVLTTLGHILTLRRSPLRLSIGLENASIETLLHAHVCTRQYCLMPLSDDLGGRKNVMTRVRWLI